jgi:hypothetical protein
MPPTTALLLVVLESVFVCIGDDGTPLYTDIPCANAAEHALRPGNVITPAPLTADEQKALAALERGAAPVRSGATGERRPRQMPRAGSDDACRAIEAALAELRATRRRGYRVGDSAALDARERSLREQRAASC